MNIPLTHGRFTQVDEADALRLAGIKLYTLNNTIHRKMYAGVYQRSISKMTLLHRWILGVTDRSVTVDHINGDSLDNRRSNLRLCSLSENLMNRKLARNNTTGFKGIYQKKGASRWRAFISLNGKQRWIGYFASKEEAARAYDAKAIELYGPYARLNFPRSE